MQFKTALLFACALVATSAAPAMAQGFGKKLQAFGKWTVYRSVDEFTDKASCTAVFGTDGKVQLTDHSFAFSLRGAGGVGGYTLRLDNNEPDEMKLPSSIEKDISVVFFEGDDFKRVTGAKRVRLQVLTVLSDLKNFDVDFTNGAQILAALRTKQCGYTS